MNYLLRNEYQTKDNMMADRIAPADQVAVLGMKFKENGNPRVVVEIIKELFYSTGKSLYQIFKEISTGDTLKIDSFVVLINKYSHNTMQESDIRAAFNSVSKSANKQQLSFQEFEGGFKIVVPLRGSIQNETVII